MPVRTEYSLRLDFPYEIIREANTTLEASIERDGEIVPVTLAGSSIEILREDGTALVVAGTALTQVNAGVAEFDILAAIVPATLPFATNYIVRWTLVMPDGADHLFIEEARLTRFKLYNPVSVQDMRDEFIEIDTWARRTGRTPQVKLDSAFKSIKRRLFNQGRDPMLILSPSALRDAVLAMACAKQLSDFHASTGSEKFKEAAAEQRAAFKAAWNDMKLTLDQNESGQGSVLEQRKSAVATIWTGSANRRGWTPLR